MSRISKEWLSDEEAEKMLEAVPVIPGDDTFLKSLKRRKKTSGLKRLPPMLCFLRP